MEVNIVTKEDLQLLRTQLVDDLRQLIESVKKEKEKRWLKNSEVKKLLNISSNTVSRLRIAGKLTSTKVGGIHYYCTDDIEDLLGGRK